MGQKSIGKNIAFEAFITRIKESEIEEEEAKKFCETNNKKYEV
jgi:hypothetical protein